MDSSDDSAGRALLNKWKTMDAVVRAKFTTMGTCDCVFEAFGKIAALESGLVHIGGEEFNLICALPPGSFKDVCDEELLFRINPALVGKQPETLTIVFAWNEECVLTRPSELSS